MFSAIFRLIMNNWAAFPDSSYSHRRPRATGNETLFFALVVVGWGGVGHANVLVNFLTVSTQWLWRHSLTEKKS